MRDAPELDLHALFPELDGAAPPAGDGASGPLPADVIAARLADFLRSRGSPVDARAADPAFAATTLPEGPQPLDGYLDFLFDAVVRHGVRTHSPRFVGHMTSALPRFVPAVARVVTALNQNVVKLETSGAFTTLERQALAMLHQLVYRRDAAFYAAHAQDAESTLGTMVSGGTIGNVAALWCARNRRFGPSGEGEAAFAGVDAEGLAAALVHHGYRRAVVVGSSLLHYSLRKAVDLLGLGENNLVRVPADRDGRLDPARLRRVLDAHRAAGDCVLAVVGIAGTTETGSVDPLDAIADLAAEHGAHFHVDAAWGGPTLLSRTHAHLLAGIERADTVVIDGHKQLYLPMGVGMLLMRDPTLARSIEKTAGYIVRAGSADLGRRTLEGSRPASAVYLHAGLHVIGRRGYEALVDAGIARARSMAAEIERRDAFELLNRPELNILVYRHVPADLRARAAAGTLTPADNARIDALNVRLQEAQRAAGASFVSRTTLTHTRHGVPLVALRVVLANPLTTPDDLRAVLDEQAALAEALGG